MKTLPSFIASLSLATTVVLTVSMAQDPDQKKEPRPAPAVVPLSKVKWGALNPARGEMGPRAANLWGDRTGAGTTGFLVRFADGFSSPPHIHNVTYRGLVISGLVHNDDPDAAEMWMPPGSFWTQPAGEVHITAARGENVLAYIEIESGPYRVMPAEEASDNGERPINVDAANIVWLDSSSCRWIDPAASATLSDSAKIAFLWGSPQDGQPGGSLLKLPAGFSGKIRSGGSTLRAVVIKGQPRHRLAGGTAVETMEPGESFGSEGDGVHEISFDGEGECIIYVRSKAGFEVTAE